MIKNIINLTKILIKNTYQNPYIFDKKTNKINKKSALFWMFAVLSVAISYISFYVIRELVNVGEPKVFLNIWFLVIFIIMIFQSVLISGNIFYFSEDIKNLLPLPIKSVELLLSKLNTIIFNLYISEVLLAFIPFFIYGILTYANIVFYMYLIIVMIIFPIIPAIISSIVTMLFMRFSKFAKNKDLFQIIIVLLVLSVLFIFEFYIVKNSTTLNSLNQENSINIIGMFNNKLIEINKYFLIINPTINLLENSNKVSSILNLIYLILINILSIFIFLIIEKNKYLKNILKNNNITKINKNKKINLNKICKKENKEKKYLKIEFKKIFKNPIYFMQCIYPIFILLISLIIVILILAPKIKMFFENELIKENLQNFPVDLSVLFIIVGIIQILFTLSNISITAISRDGRNAAFMKNIPISLNKQFVLRGIPQAIINEVVIITILILIKFIFKEFNFIYLFLIFILSTIINLINSYLMLIIDLKKPNLNWDNEYEVMKQNNNKIFQFLFTVIIILLLVYIEKILRSINLSISIFISISIFSLIFIFIIIYAKVNTKKLFSKIK